MTQTDQAPTLSEIISLLDQCPKHPLLKTEETEPMTWLHDWLMHYSRVFDLSRGFLVNRCALYWAGYDAPDGIDGQSFVESCQDTNGSLHNLAQILDTDLQIFELAPNNTDKADAGSLAMAASYGMMAIEESTQLFCACSFGRGVNSVSKTALDALKNANEISLDNFLIQYCGLDHTAMIGACIAASVKGIPVILEGTSGLLVKTILTKYAPQSFDHIICTEHLSMPVTNTLPGHAMLQTAIMLKTLQVASDKTDCGKIKQAA